jgi:hypothetical protein
MLPGYDYPVLAATFHLTTHQEAIFWGVVALLVVFAVLKFIIKLAWHLALLIGFVILVVVVAGWLHIHA